MTKSGSIALTEITQENNYYPFGNFQDNLNLHCYDYGARFYDAALGRWNKQDKLTEKYEYFSIST